MQPGLFKAQDGQLYWVQGVGKMHDTEEEMVFYRSAVRPGTLIMPLARFTEQVSPGKGKKKTPRFTRWGE